MIRSVSAKIQQREVMYQTRDGVFHLISNAKEKLSIKHETQCFMPCLCPFEGHKYGCRKPTETSVFEFSYKCVNSSLEELIQIKVTFIPRQGMFRQKNLTKHFQPTIFFTQKPLLQNEVPFQTENLFKQRCLGAVMPYDGRNSEESGAPNDNFRKISVRKTI